MPAGKCVRGMLAQRNKTTYCWYRFHTILDLPYWKGEWRNNGKLLCTYLSSSNTKTVIKEERRVLNNTSNRTSAGNFPEDESHGVDVGPLERLKMLHVYWIVKHFWGHIPVERHQVIIFDEESKIIIQRFDDTKAKSFSRFNVVSPRDEKMPWKGEKAAGFEVVWK